MKHSTIPIFAFAAALILTNWQFVLAQTTAPESRNAVIVAPNDSAKLSHHYASVNGIRLHYVRAGQGEPLFLLHGFPQTWYAFRKIIPSLAARYTVIAPDLRGFGDSDKPQSGYDKRTVAEDVYLLAQQLGFKRFKLVGHDVGGTVAYALAAAHPEMVERLILTECLLPGFGLEENMDVSRGGAWHYGFQMQRDVPEMLTEGKERKYIVALMRIRLFVPDAISETDFDEYARSYAAPGAMRGAFEHYRAFLADGEYNRRNAARKLTMPILVIGAEYGVKDRLFKGVEQIAENARGIIAADCGHYVAEERPEYFVEQISTFFARN